MTDFVTVGSAGDVAEGDLMGYQAGEQQVAVARVDGKLYAFSDICTHQGCNLSTGELDGTTIECECHGSMFDITTGEVRNGPATEPIATFEAREEGDDIQVSV